MRYGGKDRKKRGIPLRQANNSSTIIFVLLLVLMAVNNIRNGSGSIGDWILQEILMLPGIIIGLSFHEFAHAFVSDKLGDPLPRIQGRVTLNPMAHIDFVGFVALLFVGFGWGRPVEIDPRNYKHPRRDEFLVAFAGVIMNLLVAFVFTLVLKGYIAAVGYYAAPTGIQGTLYHIILYVIYINIALMIFNLIPIPPLDGFNIITQIFNLRRYRWWDKVYQYGYFILLLLILLNFTDRILTPGVQFFLQLFGQLL